MTYSTRHSSRFICLFPTLSHLKITLFIKSHTSSNSPTINSTFWCFILKCHDVDHFNNFCIDFLVRQHRERASDRRDPLTLILFEFSTSCHSLLPLNKWLDAAVIILIGLVKLTSLWGKLDIIWAFFFLSFFLSVHLSIWSVCVCPYRPGVLHAVVRYNRLEKTIG